MSDSKVPLGRVRRGFSSGVVAPVGRLVLVSGQVAVDDDGQVVAEGDLGGQSRYVLERVRSVLRAAGGDLGDVVKLTTFLTDMSRYGEFSTVREQLFQEPFPASSSVGVSALIRPELLIEVEAVAVVSDGRAADA